MSAVIVGVLVGANAPIGLALLVVLLYLPLVVYAPRMALLAFVPLVFLEGLSAFNTGGKAAGLLVVGAWIGAYATWREAARDLFSRQRRLVEALALLLVWTCLSLVWADDPGVAKGDLWHWFAVAVLFLIVATWVNDVRSLRLVMIAFVVGAVLTVIVGFATGMQLADASGQGTARLEGAAGDPNFLAAGLVAAIVLAGGLLMSARTGPQRLALVGAVGVMTIGLVASQSRGGLLAGVAILIAAFVFFKRWRGPVALFTIALLALGTIMFAATPGAWERVTSAENGGAGRQSLWTVALRASQDYPVTGVGLANFPLIAPEYTREPGALDRVQKIEQKTLVHSLYLQQLVDTGIVGLLLLLAVAFGSMRAAWLAAKRAERGGDPELQTLALAILVATIGMLAASAFISDAVDRELWILFGLGPAALGIAARRQSVPNAPA